MKKKYITAISFLMLFISSLFGSDDLVYSLKIEGMIDNGLVPYVKRGIAEAEENKADYVLIEINTFGGRVDAATDLKDIIINSKVPTAAYINKRAISAGSLIALSCNKIIMAEGSSMGATTVVNTHGQKQSEKAQSFMRAEMGSTAERTGRNSLIAQAMVDEDIEILDVVEKGKLLTLTAKGALDNKMCDAIISDKDKIYTYLGMDEPEETIITVSFAENIIRFLTNPVLSSLLMTLGFLGLIFEIKTPGWGVGGTVGIICLTLFFGSHYIINLADYFEIIIFLTGMVLLALEIFVIPGFGLAGVLGILCILGSFYMTLLGKFPTSLDMVEAGAVLSSSFILMIFGSYFIIKYLPGTRMFNFMVVNDKGETGAAVKQSRVYSTLFNKTGKASTDLRLSGKAKIEGMEYQVISRDEYIKKNEEIIVDSIEGNKIFVIKKDKIEIPN